MNRKGQTAMEYLMTYGWAIIIVVIVGVMLWRLGVFTPQVGKTSTGFDEFSVGTNFKITSGGTATIVLQNMDKQSRAVTVNNATAGGQACTGVGSVSAGTSLILNCAGLAGGATGTAYTGVDIVIGYTVGGMDYTETGKISGKYE